MTNWFLLFNQREEHFVKVCPLALFVVFRALDLERILETHTADPRLSGGIMIEEKYTDSGD